MPHFNSCKKQYGIMPVHCWQEWNQQADKQHCSVNIMSALHTNDKNESLGLTWVNYVGGWVPAFKATQHTMLSYTTDFSQSGLDDPQISTEQLSEEKITWVSAFPITSKGSRISLRHQLRSIQQTGQNDQWTQGCCPKVCTDFNLTDFLKTSWHHCTTSYFKS